GQWLAQIVRRLWAVPFRATLLFVPPSLWDDSDRYVWDGRVQASGMNPYLYPPEADRLESLRDEEWTRINHRGVPTIYPPLAEAVFATVAGAGLDEIGDKAVFVLFDVAAAGAPALLLRPPRRPARWPSSCAGSAGRCPWRRCTRGILSWSSRSPEAATPTPSGSSS